MRGDAGGDLTGKWDAAEVEAFADRVEAEIEAHAPGFRALVTGRHVLSPPALEARNANLAGGALGGGTTALLAAGRVPADPGPRPGRDARSAACSSRRRRRTRVVACTARAAPTPPGPRSPPTASGRSPAAAADARRASDAVDRTAPRSVEVGEVAEGAADDGEGGEVEDVGPLDVVHAGRGSARPRRACAAEPGVDACARAVPSASVSVITASVSACCDS